MESAKNQLLRNFRSGSIFDFCNTIGTFRTLPNSMTMSGRQGKADLNNAGVDIRKYPRAIMRPTCGVPRFTKSPAVVEPDDNTGRRAGAG